MWKNLHAFYCSKEWNQFRDVVIAKRHNLCEDCNKLIISPKDIQIHHDKIELTLENVNDFNISLNENNVKVLCNECHNKRHKRFGHKQRKIYIVYGAPLAGKKTLASQMFKYGDIILDIDRIYEAISGLSLMNKPNNLRFNAFRVHDLILDMVKTRYGQWNDAYIIGGYASKLERERLASELNAELIFCNATKSECYERLVGCNDYRSIAVDEWRKYIDKWFDEYTE